MVLGWLGHRRFLYVALVLLLVGLLAAVFGPAVTSWSPLDQDMLVMSQGQMIIAPLPPGTGGHVLGTDSSGHDLLSLIAYGARWTLGLVLATVLLRLLIAVPLGMTCGWLGGEAAQLLEGAAALASGIPAVIAGVLALATLDQLTVSPASYTAWFIFIVALPGCPRLASQVARRTGQVQRRPFIEAARAAGQNGVGTLRTHIWPHLLPPLTVQVATEAASVLLLLAELGILGTYFPGSQAMTSAGLTHIPEWGSILSQARLQAFSAPWIPISAAAAFALATGLFTLAGEFLRLHWQQHPGTN